MLKTILIQLIGGIGFITLATSYFKKTKSQILYMQIIAYIFFTTHYFLLDGITGALCNFIGLLALITIYLFDKYKLKNKMFISMIFILILLILNIISFQNIYSLFPMIASVIAIISFIDSSVNNIRIVGVIATLCWLFYAVAYKSYISIIFEILTLINVSIAIIKNRRKI